MSIMLLLALAAAAPAQPTAAPATLQAAARAFGRPYLAPGTVPDSLLLDPAPPAAGSAAMARDEAAAADAVGQRGSARWQQAVIDADLFGANPADSFSCAAGVALSPETTPKTAALLRRLAADLGMSTGPTKRRYMRARPFTVNGQPSCTPEFEAVLRKDGSYPSGHSAIGYGWGLVLAELEPARAAQLVARGREFGDSRRICNVHWLSDIEEGRIVAAAVIARVHAEPEFQADLAAAKAELAAAPAATDCPPRK